MLNSVVKQFENIVRQFPNKVAVRDEKESITFCEYYNYSKIIATNIIDIFMKKGVIAVYLPQSILCLETLMGILYSGNCYCPIPFESPQMRARKIIEKLHPLCIITDEENYEFILSCIPENMNILLTKDLVKGISNDFELNRIIGRVIDTDPAYVLFTSGSTGVPKGVTVPHRAIIDYLEWSIENFNLRDDTILANQAPFHFDASMPDIYTPLFTGAELILVKKKLFMFPVKLVQYLNEMHVNTLIWVPSALQVMTNRDVFRKHCLMYLRLVMFCGEVMPNRHLNIWRRYYPNVQFVNLYGPTEAAYACCYYIVDRKFADDEALPIGYPCCNTDILLLNKINEQVTKMLEVGEICIRGSSLALGYYADRENGSFTQNPLNNTYQDTIYRTGDLGSINMKGELIYIGRKDYQIKHMGYRIELGEIEMVASSISYLSLVCALYNADKDDIVLFYEEKGYHEVSEIVNDLSLKLPAYMIPNSFIKMKNMPYNINGKIDRPLLMSLMGEMKKDENSRADIE